VIAAGRDDPAKRIMFIGEHVHGVVCDRTERHPSRVLHRVNRTMRLAEHAREDAVTDGRLVGNPIGFGCIGQALAQPAQSRDLVLVLPESVECLIVGFEGSSEGFDRECEHLHGEMQAVARGEGDVGGERCCARGSVHQRHRLALFEVGVDPAHQLKKRQDFTGPILPAERKCGQRAIEEVRDPLSDDRSSLRMPFDEVRETGEDDPAHDMLVEIGFATEARARVSTSCARIVPLLARGQGPADFDACPGRGPVDECSAIRIEQRDERFARAAILRRASWPICTPSPPRETRRKFSSVKSRRLSTRTVID
jgi:hypothetical protein